MFFNPFPKIIRIPNIQLIIKSTSQNICVEHMCLKLYQEMNAESICILIKLKQVEILNNSSIITPMREIDRKCTEEDVAAIKTHLGLVFRTTSEATDAYVKRLPIPDTGIGAAFFKDEDVKFIVNREFFLERFFEECFAEPPQKVTPKIAKSFLGGFHAWVNILEESYLIQNTESSVEAANIVRELDIRSAYFFAKDKEFKFKNEIETFPPGLSERNEAQKKHNKWKLYADIAEQAYVIEMKMSTTPKHRKSLMQ